MKALNVLMLIVCTACAGVCLAKGWWPEFATNAAAIAVLVYVIERKTP